MAFTRDANLDTVIRHFSRGDQTCADPEIFMRGGPTKMVIFLSQTTGVGGGGGGSNP